MSITAGVSGDDPEPVPDGGDEDVVDIVTDNVEEAVSSASADAFVGGIAVALFLLLPEGQRQIAGVFAALAGVELGDTHGRKKVPLDVLREGSGAVAGFVVGAVGATAAMALGYL